MQKVETAHLIRTSELHAHIGQPVRLQGWTHALRRFGGVNFLVLRDGYGIVQAVFEDESALAPILDDQLAPETVLALEGDVVASAQAPGGCELRDPVITIISP